MSFDTPSTQPPFLCYRIFSHRIHGTHRSSCWEYSPTRIHGTHRSSCWEYSPTRIHGTHRSSCWEYSPTDFTAQIVRLRRPPTEFRSQKLGCAPIRSGGILPPQQPITLIFRGCSICENLWHLWEPPLSKKVLWILWIPWEVLPKQKVLWILWIPWEVLPKQKVLLSMLISKYFDHYF